MTSPSVAFVTPSYAGDFERCQLLCESLDMMAREPIHHYILVADHDLALFRQCAGPNREVIAESAILPSWLKVMKRPFSGGRHMWVGLSPFVWPMSGWHTQQLRKMLIARTISDDIMVMADSDSLFVKPFDKSIFMRNGAVRLYVKERAIDAGQNYAYHRQWVKSAAKLLGIATPALPAHDFINNMVTWRRDHVLAMLKWIEAQTSRDVVAALGRYRTFSEYQIYGAFASEILGNAGHFRTAQSLSHTYWSGDALTHETLSRFVDGLHPEQIAIGVQSFTGTSTELLRDYLAARARDL